HSRLSTTTATCSASAALASCNPTLRKREARALNAAKRGGSLTEELHQGVIPPLRTRWPRLLGPHHLCPHPSRGDSRCRHANRIFLSVLHSTNRHCPGSQSS